MKLLSRAEILGANDVTTEDVKVPEWANGDPDAVVRIRNLTAAGRGRFIQRSIAAKQAAEGDKVKGDFEVEVLLVAMTAVDEKNEAIFTEEDIRDLGGKSAAPIGRLANAAQRLSGLMPEAQEDAAKKSATTPS